ncbi:MAG TPA: sugar ABC transporter substrate-binding protein [Chloroflexota bacterium]|nr:sugar ABC transporter substrate-binding protein [Chloroflexota bacterium]
MIGLASMSRRRVLARGAAAAGGTMLAACRGEPAAPAPAAAGKEPAALLMVNYGAIPQGWSDLGQAFTAEYPRITVEFSGLEGATWGAYFEKVAVMAAAGTPPDVARVAVEGVQMVASKGMALPLDPFIKRDQQDLKDYFPDINQSMLKSMAYQGKQYQLPFTWNGPVIHYNTTLFERAGIARPKDDWTLETFLDAARRLTRDDVWGISTPNAYWGGLIPWLFLAGGDLLSDDWKQSRANDPKTVEAVELYQSLSARLRVAPPNGTGADFNTGKLAMRADGGGNLRLGMIERGMHDFDVLYFPKWRTQTHEYGGTGFPIMKDSKHHEAAWLLVKYLIRKESIASFVANVAQTPARRSVAYDMWIKPGEPPQHYRIYFDMLDRGARPVPAPPEYNEVEALTLKHLRQVTANEVSAKAAMESLHSELSELLARRTTSS